MFTEKGSCSLLLLYYHCQTRKCLYLLIWYFQWACFFLFFSFLLYYVFFFPTFLAVLLLNNYELLTFFVCKYKFNFKWVRYVINCHCHIYKCLFTLSMETMFTPCCILAIWKDVESSDDGKRSCLVAGFGKNWTCDVNNCSKF